ncbi:MAG: hypothetical protein J6K42_01800 [Clostridia bacterium]|nr:hypothetical protein [Clostridia bacterium]
MKKTSKIIFRIVVFLIIALASVAIYYFVLSLNRANKKSSELDKNSENSSVVENNTQVGSNNTNNVVNSNVTQNFINEDQNIKRSITLKNSEKEVRRLTVGVANFVCKEQEPTIYGLDSSIAKKIENKLKENYTKVWKEINEQSQDSDVNEILQGYNEYGYAEEIGFEQEYEIEYYNNKIITFKRIFSGSLGGVSWDSTSGISFYLNNGEEVNIEDIVIDKTNYQDACLKSVYKQLKNDERYDELNEGYEEIVNDAIGKISGYIVKEGIMCVEIPKYSIASGAAGQFDYVVSFDEISDYIDISKIK